MSRQERYGTRDLTFSGWHRTLPDYCTTIDIDFLEYCKICRAPLGLIEIARDVGQAYKPTTVMEQLAKKAGVQAYLILYKLEENGIGTCRMAQIYPNKTRLFTMTPEEVADTIRGIHSVCTQCCHDESKAGNAHGA
jgi:hypothetical protein